MFVCKRLWVSTVTAVVSVLGLTAAASAQDFDRIVTFGDSLSDRGNLSEAGVVFYAPPFNTLTRFTSPGGITWVEILAGGDMTGVLAAGGGAPLTGDVNFAFGGARADDDVANPPGVPDQITTYTGLGGVFGPNDLVTVWAGANDIFQDLAAASAGGVPGITALGTETAGNQVDNVNTLIGLGAKTLLVPNLPDIGKAPEFNTNPTTSFASTLAATTFNASLASGLRGLSRPADVNIIEMDVEAAFDIVISNPAAFGFTNVTQACIATPSCAGGTAADQRNFLFWDGVHPTAAGHELLALYAGLLLNSDETSRAIAPIAEVGLWSRLHSNNAVFDRMTSWLAGTYAQQNGLYAEVVGIHGDQDANSSRGGYDFDLYGVRAGLDQQFGNLLVGGALSVLTGETESASLSTDNVSVSGDIYATSYFGPLFVSGQAGIATQFIDDYERNTGFGPVVAKADTNVDQYSVAGSVGAVLPIGQSAIIPSARVGYVNSEMEGFEETAPILAASYESRELSTAFWSAQVRASTNIAMGASKTAAYAEVGYEDFFSSDNDSVVAQLVNNTALPTSVDITDPEGRGVFFKVGASSKVNDMISVDLDYGLALHNGDGETHSGKVRVKIPIGAESVAAAAQN